MYFSITTSKIKVLYCKERKCSFKGVSRRRPDAQTLLFCSESWLPLGQRETTSWDLRLASQINRMPVECCCLWFKQGNAFADASLVTTCLFTPMIFGRPERIQVHSTTDYGMINGTSQHTGGYVTFSLHCADDWEGLAIVKVFDCTLAGFLYHYYSLWSISKTCFQFKRSA